MPTYSLLGLSGSLRKASTNSLLLHEASCLFGECTYSQGDLKLPLYDGDDEAASVANKGYVRFM